MSIGFSAGGVIARPGQAIQFASLLQQAAGAGPEYLVLVGLDRDRYTGNAQGVTGTLSGNGQTDVFKKAFDGSDALALGIVFSYASKGYYNAQYGYLDALVLNASTELNRCETFALYGFGVLGQTDSALEAKLQAEVAAPGFNGTAFMTDARYDASAHLGSLAVVTLADYTDSTPNAATPGEIAAIAQRYVGQTWNDNGCWVLAASIAAEAGASLPLTSDQARTDLTTAVGNGEWMVAYDSAHASAAEKAHWQQQIRTGDIIVVNNSCGGHITTAVSGAGYSAAYLDNSGDKSSDGFAHDIVIEGAHTVLPWILNSDPDNVVIYRLDTPVITARNGLAGSGAIASLFSVSDPAGKAITSYQVYDTAGGSFSAGTAHSAAQALPVSAADMANLRFTAGASGSVWVRASNGSYWGDWVSIPVAPGTVQPAAVHAVNDTYYIHGGRSVALHSLVSVDSSSAAVKSYTIHYTSMSGTMDVDGVPVQAQVGSNGDKFFTVSAEDFQHLNFKAGQYAGGDPVTITADNGSAVTPVAAQITMTTLIPTVQGIAHWVAPNTEVSLASLFAVTLPDDVPVTSYAISLNGVVVIDWGGNKPSSGGALHLNGATDMLAGSGVPPGNYQIAAADLGKVTFVAAPDSGMQFIEIWANDGAGGAPGVATLNTTTTSSGITATAAKVVAGNQIAIAPLLSKPAASDPLYYRLIDPVGLGSLQLDKSATNLLSKNDFTPGVYILTAKDLAALSYAGLGSGNETISVSMSTDMLHWSAETNLVVSNVPVQRDVIQGSPAIDTVQLKGLVADYLATQDANGWTLRKVNEDSTIHVLQNVERVQFDDGKLAFDTNGSAGDLYRLYQAAMNRKPDAAGLGYWLQTMDHGASLSDVAHAFVTSSEFVTRYGQQSTAEFLANLYQNVLHRTPDAAGLQYWLGSMDGGLTRENVLVGFAESPENAAQVAAAIQHGILYI